MILERGGAPLGIDAIAAMVGEGAALLVTRALLAAGLRVDLDRDVPRFLELYAGRLLATTRLYDGTREMLDAVGTRAALAVLTNKPQRHSEAVLRGLGIVDRFQSILGGDTAYGRKPDPAGLRRLMASAGAPAAETLLVGDSAIDVKTARAAAVRICLVRYGFGFSTAAPLLRGDEIVIDAPGGVVGLVGA